jgi:hypothetical protein
VTALLFRCSSVGKLMTEPRSKAEGPLSQGARTHVRELAAQAIFGVDFEFTSKETEKGKICEPDSIALLNKVRGLSLVKNTERRNNALLTGEADLFDTGRRRGHDLKTSWSIKTFPLVLADCEDKLYDWQMRGYMQLWDADEWEVNYCLVNTPDNLIGYEPLALHFVDHIPPHHRVTTWTIKRDSEKERSMAEKVRCARDYYAQVVSEFDRAHPSSFADVAALVHPQAEERPPISPAALPAPQGN